MKSLKVLLCGLGLVSLASSALASDVGVSVSIGEPGFYGQIDLGNAPPPVLVQQQPVIVQTGPEVVHEPIYLRVPADHRKHWKQYCSRYNACNRPVYFVQDKWYRQVYAPKYRSMHQHHADEHQNWDRHEEHHEEEHHGDDHRGDWDHNH